MTACTRVSVLSREILNFNLGHWKDEPLGQSERHPSKKGRGGGKMETSKAI